MGKPGLEEIASEPDEKWSFGGGPEQDFFRNLAKGDGYDGLKFFLRMIRKIDLLKQEEELKLIKEAQAGSIEARNKLLLANIRFIIFTAKQNRHHYDTAVEIRDLVQEGVFGLMRAIEKYKFSMKNKDGKPYRLTTYAGN